MRHKVLGAALCALVSLSCATFVHGAGVKHETKSWDHNGAAFAEASQYISENSDLNLLTFPGAKLVRATELDGPGHSLCTVARNGRNRNRTLPPRPRTCRPFGG